mmetsp:Transcript_49872/g.156083  ORF Transcript_49872/g.156083 Transcript_49872/m.156083 type:complete len:225 (+) Transcript_49872:624-1298(+)
MVRMSPRRCFITTYASATFVKILAKKRLIRSTQPSFLSPRREMLDRLLALSFPTTCWYCRGPSSARRYSTTPFLEHSISSPDTSIPDSSTVPSLSQTIPRPFFSNVLPTSSTVVSAAVTDTAAAIDRSILVPSTSTDARWLALIPHLTDPLIAPPRTSTLVCAPSAVMPLRWEEDKVQSFSSHLLPASACTPLFSLKRKRQSERRQEVRAWREVTAAESFSRPQ